MRAAAQLSPPKPEPMMTASQCSSSVAASVAVAVTSGELGRRRGERRNGFREDRGGRREVLRRAERCAAEDAIGGAVASRKAGEAGGMTGEDGRREDGRREDAQGEQEM